MFIQFRLSFTEALAQALLRAPQQIGGMLLRLNRAVTHHQVRQHRHHRPLTLHRLRQILV